MGGPGRGGAGPVEVDLEHVDPEPVIESGTPSFRRAARPGPRSASAPPRLRGGRRAGAARGQRDRPATIASRDATAAPARAALPAAGHYGQVAGDDDEHHRQQHAAATEGIHSRTARGASPAALQQQRERQHEPFAPGSPDRSSASAGARSRGRPRSSPAARGRRTCWPGTGPASSDFSSTNRSWALPVIPGVTVRISAYSSAYWAAKYSSSGRGPTSRISPRRTLTTCGSSSSRVAARKRPIGVKRSSSSQRHRMAGGLPPHLAELEHLEQLTAATDPPRAIDHRARASRCRWPARSPRRPARSPAARSDVSTRSKQRSGQRRRRCAPGTARRAGANHHRFLPAQHPRWSLLDHTEFAPAQPDPAGMSAARAGSSSQPPRQRPLYQTQPRMLAMLRRGSRVDRPSELAGRLVVLGERADVVPVGVGLVAPRRARRARAA